MKGFLLLVMLFVFMNSNGQLWKEHADSAKVALDQKNNRKAIEWYNKTREELRKDSLFTATYAFYTNAAANTYLSLDQAKEAEESYIESKNIREKIYGKEHLDYGRSCHNLAVLYKRIRQYEKAESLYLEAGKIFEKKYGRNSAEYASYCNSIGDLFNLMNKFNECESAWLEAKEIREKVLGRNNVDHARSCHNLGMLYYDHGQYTKAEPYLKEIMEINEILFGKTNLNYGFSCANLANLYHFTGRYKRAEELYLKAQEIIEKNRGKNHLEFASGCNNMALLYKDMGEFEKAEMLYIEAMKIREQLLGKAHPAYGAVCNNLGNLYNAMGQYDRALIFHTESKQIREKTLGKLNADYGASCVNLGSTYESLRKYKEAEMLFIEAKEVWEQINRQDHPDYNKVKINLARLYINILDYKKAEPLLSEIKKSQEITIGKNHPDYATSCMNLGVLYQRLSQLEKAESMFLEAKSINEKIMGKDHPNVALLSNYLGTLYQQTGDIRKAGEYYLEALSSQYQSINKLFLFTSEREKTYYLKEKATFDRYFYSFSLSTKDDQSVQNIYDIILKNKSLILSSIKHLRDAVYNSGDTALKRKYDSWTAGKEQLSFWYTKVVNERPDHLADLEEETNKKEKELVKHSALFGQLINQQEVTQKEVQKYLKPGTVAIEFIEFPFYDGKNWTDSTFYIALVLRKDKPQPELVYLFEKKQLDSVLNVKVNTYNSRIDKLYSTTDLYNLIWKPLENKLAGISTVYFASAGQLHLVNLAAISTPQNQTIGDKYRLVQMSTTSSIVNPSDESISTSDNILLYGGIKYTTDSSSLIQAAKRYTTDDNITRSITSGFNGPDEIADLPNSEIEVDEIDRMAKQKGYNSKIFKGVEANEESLKSINGKKSPSILHIVTHGFFNTDPIKLKSKETLAGGKAFALSDDPLMRSGLMMAGANNIWMGKPINGIEDGVLTGYEVSNMYLPNTKLVVLSACETALGQVQGSEGVYGLQRAFKIAGVENILMSLWQVPDNTTAEFMLLFYKQLFEKKSVSEAFYFTQRAMRDKYRGNPHKWAGLVLIQ